MGVKIRCCQYCGQTLPEIRLGARLTPIKARIFDLIMRGGEDGIEKRDIFDIVFSEQMVEHPERNYYPVLKTHISQINDAISDSGYKIMGERGVARLVRVKSAT